MRQRSLMLGSLGGILIGATLLGFGINSLFRDRPENYQVQLVREAEHFDPALDLTIRSLDTMREEGAALRDDVPPAPTRSSLPDSQQ